MDKPLVVPAGVLPDDIAAKVLEPARVALAVEEPPRPLIPKLCIYCEHFTCSYVESEPGAGDAALMLKCEKGKFNLAGRPLRNTSQLRMYVNIAQKCELFELPANKGVPSGEQFGKGGSLTVLPPSNT
jgi:hypothetical protein